MSGIVGLLELDGSAARLDDVERLANLRLNDLAAPVPHGLCRSFSVALIDGSRGAGTGSYDDRFAAASGTVVALDGRAGGIEDAADGRPSHPSAGDAARIGHAYGLLGDAFAPSLNGDFAFALFDSTADRLLLARDAMGARDLYYTRAGRTLLFSSDLRALLRDPRVSRAPDLGVLSELLLDKWDDGAHTCFEGIHAVPPGHFVIAANGAVTVKRFFAFDPSRRIRYRDARDYVGGFRPLFESAVRRRMPSTGPVAVLLSGGLDSSSVYCQSLTLASSGRRTPVHGVSMVFPSDAHADESGHLDTLEQWSGCPLARLAVQDIGQVTGAREFIAESGVPTLIWDAHARLFAEARRAGCTTVLDGYFGDQMLFGRAYLRDLIREGRWRKIRNDLRTFAAWMEDSSGVFEQELRSGIVRALVPRALYGVLKRRARAARVKRYAPWYTRSFVDRLLERQLARFPRVYAATHHAEEYFGHATAGHYLFYFRRQRLAARMHDLDLGSPFRDRDLASYLMAIPGEMVNPGGIPKGLLRDAMNGMLPPSIRMRRGKADFTAAVNRGLLRDFEPIAAILRPDSLAVQAGIVEAGPLQQSLDGYRKRIAAGGDGLAGWQLGEVVALELWLREFFY